MSTELAIPRANFVGLRFHGRAYSALAGTPFEGDNVEELENSFHQAVDGYLELCKSRGKAPDKPYSGKFLVRVDPALHRKLVTDAIEVEKQATGPSHAAMERW